MTVPVPPEHLVQSRQFLPALAVKSFRADSARAILKHRRSQLSCPIPPQHLHHPAVLAQSS